MLTFEQIKELVELVAKHRLSGFEMERSGFRLKVEGEVDSPAAAAVAPFPQAVNYAVAGAPPESAPPPALAPSVIPGASRELPTPEGKAVAPEVPAGAHVLKSPIVGTFYSARSPDSAPFVQLGDQVKKGQVLCIVEAMKLMNEIESDADGEIVHIYSDNGQPVEYEEPLFAIRAR